MPRNAECWVRLTTGQWVENKSVQLDQTVPRCSGKAVTLCSMRLATVVPPCGMGTKLEPICGREAALAAGSPAQRDEIPIPPSGRGIGRQMRPFFAFSLRLVACCLWLVSDYDRCGEKAAVEIRPGRLVFLPVFSFSGLWLAVCCLSLGLLFGKRGRQT